MAKFSILLPPSDVQNKHGNKFAPDVFDYREKTTFNHFHHLIGDRRALIDAIHRFIEVDGEDAAAEALGGSDTVTVIKQVYTAELMAARSRYEAGPFYESLDFTGLPTGAQRRFLENSVIISGLFGVLRPDDLVPESHVPIDAEIPGIGSVSDFWRPVVTPLVNEAVSGSFLWDLLPDEYRPVWDDERTYSGRACIAFFDRGGHEVEDSLALRGKLVHHLVQQNTIGQECAASWGEADSQGFRFDEGRSELDDPMNLVFAFSRS